jgi:class 3 adenylate cyclase
MGDGIGGIAVHIAARVASMAGPDEVLVSAALPPLVVGSDIRFDDKGDHKLKGVPGSWRVFSVRR